MIDYLHWCKWILNFSPVNTHVRVCYSLTDDVDKLCCVCSQTVLLLLGIGRFTFNASFDGHHGIMICFVVMMSWVTLIIQSHCHELAHMASPLMTWNGILNDESGRLKEHVFMCWFVDISDDVFIRSSYTYEQTRLLFISDNLLVLCDVCLLFAILVCSMHE